MMNRYAELETSYGRMLVTSPLSSDFQRSQHRRFIFEQRWEVSATVQFDGSLSISFNPIGLRREDKGPLALLGKLPCCKQCQIFGLARVWLSIRCARRNLFYETRQERPLLLKVIIESCGIALPDQCTETLPRRAPG